jgi:hypothetical protein
VSAAATDRGAAHLLTYVRVIARARLRSAWRRLRRRRLGPVMLVVVVLASFAAAAGLAGAGYAAGVGLRLGGDRLSAELIRLGLPPDGAPLFLPLAVFLIGWFGLFFITFASLLGTLYLRRDLPMLLVAPVPVRAVFLAQFLEALAVPMYWTLVLGLSTLWGYGAGLRYGPLYFLLAPLLLLTLPLVPLGLSAMTTLLLLRWVPAPRASEILTVIGTAFGIGIWVLTQSMGSLVRRLDPGGRMILTSGMALAHPALPWAWAARGLVAAGTGELLAALVLGGGYVALGLAALAGSTVLAERLYYDGWVQGGERPGRERRARVGRSADRDRPSTAVGRPMLAVARKDWRLMRRDPRGYASLLWVLAMIGFWAWRLGRPLGRMPVGGDMGGMAFDLFGSLTPVGVALLFSGYRWGMESISRDQQAFQLVLAAPVRMRDVVLGKWLSAYVPSLALGVLVMVVFTVVMHLGPWILVRNVLILMPILAGEIGIMLALAASRPNFEWTDPRQMAGGLTGCLGGLAASMYMAVSLAIVGLGLALPAILGLPSVLGVLAWAVTSLVGGGITALAVTFAAERLALVEL